MQKQRALARLSSFVGSADRLSPGVIVFASLRAIRGDRGMVQKNVIAFGGNKAVAAAPVGIELCRPLPDVSACNSLHRLGLAVLMVIGHTSDVDPYALYRRVFFRTLGITPPESDLKHFVIQTLPFRAMFRLPPALTSYF